LVGAPFGGLVEAASTPTIHDLEDSGHRLIRDADDAIGKEIDRAGSVTAGVVAQVDSSLAARLDQVDHSLAARIVQVKTGLDDTVDRAFGRLDRSIGRLDDMARRRIAQAAAAANAIVAHVDQTITRTLAQADDILARRTEDLRALVSSAIDDADRAAAARIAQLDEVAARRLGNLDVIATKQSLGLEAMLLRIAALIGMVAFIAFVLWRLFAEAGQAWRAAVGIDQVHKRVGATLAGGGPRFLIQVLLAAGGVWLMIVLSRWLPHDAESRAQAQIAEHRRAFDAALHAYDFVGVRYHEAQLEILAPDETTRDRGRAAKLELLRDVFTRPARLRSLDGIKDVVAQVTEVETLIGPDDPDVIVVKAYVLWQVGATRADEHEAAQLCVQAIDLGAKLPKGEFLLGALAKNYLRAFLHDPYSGADAADLRAALDRAPDGEEGQFAHLIEYDRLLAELDRSSSAAYLEMLSAHADVKVALLQKKDASEARAKRTAAATAVIAAWRAFDDGLESPHLADDPSALSAFTLDDAVLAHALYFAAHPEANELPPALMIDSPAATPQVRIEMAPVRVDWERRYAPLIGRRARDVLAYEESQRYKAFESRDLAFEDAYVSYLIGSRGGALPKGVLLPAITIVAAERAADLQLYRGGATLASQILSSPDSTTAAAIDADYAARRLRFL
ncbi:MAG TPA: hypothetical protein VL463_17140, partial [Kofleriaceae bacterium]|nr:hypothetical protein [Kofleriaceae bacterium]